MAACHGNQQLIGMESMLYLTVAIYISRHMMKKMERSFGTDGTEAGTNLIVDANLGESGSWPWWLISVGDKVYFTSWDGDQRQLWHYWENPGPVISV